MDKVISARIDEGVARELDLLARQLKTSKKAVLEEAIRRYADSLEKDSRTDVIEQTMGVWRRDEAPADTVRRSRRTFEDAMERHHR
jgi:hypothetical protein